jgi:hypothetical protein
MILLLFWVPSPETGYSPKLVEGFSQKFAQPCKAATEIGRYSMVASSGKSWELVPPRILSLREAVHQNHRGSLTCFSDMKGDSVALDLTVIYLDQLITNDFKLFSESKQRRQLTPDR